MYSRYDQDYAPLSNNELLSKAARIEDTLARCVASVYGVVSEDLIERRNSITAECERRGI